MFFDFARLVRRAPRLAGRTSLRLALAALLLGVGVGVSPPAQAAKPGISGVVLDRNGEPVPRAVVTLAPGNVQLITDAQGKFLIDYVRDAEGQRARLAKKVDYVLEVFKPGYNLEKRKFFYKKGLVVVDTITLAEDTIDVEGDGENIDPGLFSDRTHGAGATYEGQ